MNFLDIPNHDKKKLGKIINYYRINNFKEKHPNSWSINKFIQNKNDNICSPTTLSQIENGTIIIDNDIYDELLKKLEQKYNYEKNLSEIHKIFNNRITHAFENYNDKLLDNLIKEYIEALKPYKDYILEKEFIFALNFSEKNLNLKMKDDMNKCLELFSIYPSGIQIIIADKLDGFVYNLGNPEEIRKVDRVIDLSKIDSYRLKSNYINNLIRKKYYLKAAQFLWELQNHYDKKNNILGLLRAYSIKLILLEEIGSNEWLEEVRQILPIFKQYLDKDREQIIIYIYNIAMGCFNRKKYKLALDILILVLENSNELFLPTAIYVNEICTITDTKVPPVAKNERYNKKNYPEVYNTIYKFYLLKNANSPHIELEKYIFQNIRPIFIKFSDDSIYNLFKFELEKCVEITGHTNLIYKYNRIRRRSSNS